MKILGIDPGMAIVGYCILEYDEKTSTLLHSGSIQTSKDDKEGARLAIEKLFFFRNLTTVMPVAHARGVILLALEDFELPVYEYTPIEVKQILTGYGRATKKEVEQMVKISLGTDNLPKLDDTVDAIAIAICYTRSNAVLDKYKN